MDYEILLNLIEQYGETGGTGLGLAIAKSIIELHNGRIWAESKKDIVYFHVWLPLG